MFTWTLGLKPQLVDDIAPNDLGDWFLSMVAAAGYVVTETTPAQVATEMVALIYPDAPTLMEPRRTRVLSNNVGTWLIVEVARTAGTVQELASCKVRFRQLVRDDYARAHLHRHHLVHIPDTERERKLLLGLAAPRTT